MAAIATLCPRGMRRVVVTPRSGRVVPASISARAIATLSMGLRCIVVERILSMAPTFPERGEWPTRRTASGYQTFARPGNVTVSAEKHSSTDERPASARPRARNPAAMSRLEGLQRRLHVEHAKRLESRAVPALHRRDDLEMLPPRLLGERRVRDGVAMDCRRLRPILLNKLRQLPVPAGAEDDPVKGVVRNRGGIEVARRPAANIDIVHLAEL